MSPEELGKGPVDETMRQRVHAIAQEAYRRRSEQTHPGHPIDAPTVMMAIEIALSDWTPPEPVDPDLLAFREWIMEREPDMREQPYGYDADFWDNCLSAKAYLAGARMAREQERKRAKGLVEYVDALVNGFFLYADFRKRARAALAKYRGEA